MIAEVDLQKLAELIAERSMRKLLDQKLSTTTRALEEIMKHAGNMVSAIHGANYHGPVCPPNVTKAMEDYIRWKKHALSSLPQQEHTACVVGDGHGQFLCMGDLGIPRWTPDIEKALWFVRRSDAEAFSTECEDAWTIIEHKYQNG